MSSPFGRHTQQKNTNLHLHPWTSPPPKIPTYEKNIYDFETVEPDALGGVSGLEYYETYLKLRKEQIIKNGSDRPVEDLETIDDYLTFIKNPEILDSGTLKSCISNCQDLARRYPIPEAFIAPAKTIQQEHHDNDEKKPTGGVDWNYISETPYVPPQSYYRSPRPTQPRLQFPKNNSRYFEQPYQQPFQPVELPNGQRQQQRGPHPTQFKNLTASNLAYQRCPPPYSDEESNETNMRKSSRGNKKGTDFYKLPDSLIFNPTKVTHVKKVNISAKPLCTRWKLNQPLGCKEEKKKEPETITADLPSSEDEAYETIAMDELQSMYQKAGSGSPSPRKNNSSSSPHLTRRTKGKSEKTDVNEPKLDFTIKKKEKPAKKSAVTVTLSTKVKASSEKAPAPFPSSKPTKLRPRKPQSSSSEISSLVKETHSVSARQVRSTSRIPSKKTADKPSVVRSRERKKKRNTIYSDSDTELSEEEFIPLPKRTKRVATKNTNNPNNKTKKRARATEGTHTQDHLNEAKPKEHPKKSKQKRNAPKEAYFPIRKIIGPVDIVVNCGLGKIKIESDYIPPPAIKEEPIDPENEEYGFQQFCTVQLGDTESEVTPNTTQQPHFGISSGHVNFGEIIIKEEPIEIVHSSVDVADLILDTENKV